MRTSVNWDRLQNHTTHHTTHHTTNVDAHRYDPVQCSFDVALM